MDYRGILKEYILPPLFLCLVLFAFTIPFKNKHYIFDWDQANDYQATARLATGKLTLIGPRVTSDQGFFLGPWHYYYLLPFYVLTSGSLSMGFWGALFIQTIFVVTSFVLARLWFGTFAGYTTSLLFATVGVPIEWGFMYVPLLSLIFFYLCLKTLRNQKLLPLLFLLFGFGCTTYTIFYALVIPLLYVVIRLFFKNKLTLTSILLSTFLVFLSYTPLFIFDIRHNFLNLKNVFSFFGSQNGPGTRFGYFITVFIRALNYSWINRELPFIVVLVTIIVLIVGALYLFKKDRVFVFLWLVSSLIPMSFYRGNVSEYYYAPVVMLVPFFISGLLVKTGYLGKLALFLLVSIIIATRLNLKFTNSSGINLSNKIDIVQQLDKLNVPYSISYEFPLGEDGGYDTIFKTIGHNLVLDGTALLYTVTAVGYKPISGTKIISSEKLVVYKR